MHALLGLCFALVLVTASGYETLATNTNLVEETDDPTPVEESTSSWRILYKVLSDCTARQQDMTVCLKMKAVTYLDRALGSDKPLPILEFISLTRDSNVPIQPAVTLETEEQLEASLPRSLEDRSSKLDTLLGDRLSQFYQSRSLQFSVPMDVFEGRQKGSKKIAPLLMAGVAMAAMGAQMMMGKIALLAGKALIVAKVALVLSAVIGLKKLFGGGGGGGGDSHPQVVYASGGGDHGGGWGRRRSFDAHNIAYAGQIPGQA